MFRVPFSAEQFFGVFAVYNQAVWPAQILLTGVAVAVVVLAIRYGDRAGRTAREAAGMAPVHHDGGAG